MQETCSYKLTDQQMDYMILCMIKHVSTAPSVPDEEAEIIISITDEISVAQSRPEIALMGQQIRDNYL